MIQPLPLTKISEVSFSSHKRIPFLSNTAYLSTILRGYTVAGPDLDIVDGKTIVLIGAGAFEGVAFAL